MVEYDINSIISCFIFKTFFCWYETLRYIFKPMLEKRGTEEHLPFYQQQWIWLVLLKIKIRLPVSYCNDHTFYRPTTLVYPSQNKQNCFSCKHKALLKCFSPKIILRFCNSTFIYNLTTCHIHLFMFLVQKDDTDVVIWICFIDQCRVLGLTHTQRHTTMSRLVAHIQTQI